MYSFLHLSLAERQVRCAAGAFRFGRVAGQQPSRQGPKLAGLGNLQREKYGNRLHQGTNNVINTLIN